MLHHLSCCVFYFFYCCDFIWGNLMQWVQQPRLVYLNKIHKFSLCASVMDLFCEDCLYKIDCSWLGVFTFLLCLSMIRLSDQGMLNTVNVECATPVLRRWRNGSQLGSCVRSSRHRVRVTWRRESDDGREVLSLIRVLFEF